MAAYSDGTIRWYDVENNGRELLAYFPHADRKRWVLWTPQGYYDCPPGSEDMMGWHVNRRKDQAADFFPASRFKSVFYRPDVIQRVLKTRDVAEAVNQANAARGKPESEPGAIAEVVQRLSPPVVDFVSGGVLREVEVPAEATSTRLRYTVRNTGRSKANRVEIRLNGRPLVLKAPLPDEGMEAEVEVPLPKGIGGELAVLASNALTSSEAAIVKMKRTGKASSVRQPDLYVIAAGVTRLNSNAGLDADADGVVSETEFLARHPKAVLRLDDLPGADTDAEKVADLFASQKGQLFGEVNINVLTSEKATRAGLLAAIADVAARAQTGDVLIFSFAGHGHADAKTEFFLGTHDLDPADPLTTALTGRQLAAELGSVRASVLVLLDTCNSGAALGRQENGSVVVGPDDLTGLVNTLSSAEQGIVVLSAAGESEKAFGTDTEGGIFTQALTKGINGGAAENGIVTCASLQAFVTKEVPELLAKASKNQPSGINQTPAAVMPKGVPDFAIAKP